MFKEGDKSFLKFLAISREQSTGDRINAKRSVKCVHPVSLLENRRCSFFPATWKQGCKRKGNWVTISLNLQPTIPLLPLSSFYTSSLSSLSLSLFPFFSQFCLLQRHCFPSVPNYEGKLRDRKSRNSSLFQGTNDTNAFSLVQTDTRSYFQDASFALGEGREERQHCSRCPNDIDNHENVSESN